MRARLVLILASLCVFGLGVGSDVQDAAGRTPRLRLVRVGHFDFPTYIASTPADPQAIYVLERSGRVFIVRNGHRIRRPFLDLHSDIRLAPNSEQGLLGLAFAPDYAKSRIYYVYYSNLHGDIRVRQFRRALLDRDRTLPGSGRTILALRHPDIAHYAGQLQFGPDGYLYIGIGDGGGVGDPPNNAQRLDNLFGKILRIDPRPSGRRRYLIPRGNPFVHRRGARPEIFAYGLRNPYRFSFDPVTGSVWIADVGQDRYEEVDFRRRGRLAGVNFGWSRYEGYSQYSNRAAPGAVPPILVEAHSAPVGPGRQGEVWCAIIGGYVVRDPALHGFAGRYLFADHCTGRIFSLRLSRHLRAIDVGWTGLQVSGLVISLGTDAARRVYVASKTTVYRITAG
jgi:Glucose / Sorbosone dehydrogenase